MLLAQHDGQFVGCVALRQIGEGLCEMKRLFVQPAFRGQGIGKALAQAIIEEGRRIGYKHMRLDTVMEPAKSLYRSLGFPGDPAVPARADGRRRVHGVGVVGWGLPHCDLAIGNMAVHFQEVSRTGQ